MKRLLHVTIALIIASAATTAVAQDKAPSSTASPGVILEGSTNTSIGGAAAARLGDRTTDGSAIVQGSTNVFINGKPAVTLGDKTGCGGLAIGSGSNVFINGKPVARAGDVTTGCPDK